jgi:hypothetical protein
MLQLHSGDLATYLDNLESNIWLKNTIKKFLVGDSI